MPLSILLANRFEPLDAIGLGVEADCGSTREVLSTFRGLDCLDSWSRSRPRFDGAGGHVHASLTTKLMLAPSSLANWLDSIKADARYAMRVMRRSPSMSFFSIAILGLGLGASLTIYTIVDRIILRPLPFRRAEELVILGVVSARDRALTAAASAGEFREWRDESQSFLEMAAFRVWGYELEGGNEPLRVTGARVTANLFQTLGVSALRGRTLTIGDDEPGAVPVVVLSDSLWQSAFGSNPNIIGQTLRLNGAPHTVIGIAAASGVHPGAALWVPYVFAAYELAQRGDRSVSVVGRLRPNVSTSEAREDIRRLIREEAARFPDAGAGWDARVTPLRDVLVGGSREALFILFAATCGLLVVACANVANGLIARLVARRRELAIRSAVGASPLRLLQQLVTEAGLLVGTGGILAVALTAIAVPYLARLGPDYLPRAVDLSVDRAAVAYVVLLVTGITVAISAIAARAISRMSSGAAMRTPVHSGLLGPDTFVASQVALAFVLLVDGWLLVASLRRVQAIDLGFDPRGVVSATVSLPGNRYATGAERATFFRNVSTHLAAVPSVEATAITSRIPFTTSATAGVMNSLSLVGSASTDAMRPRASTTVVSPSYFDALHIAAVDGRVFDDGDRADRELVMIVDEILASQLARDGRVVGARARFDGATGADTAARLIVGVVRSVRMIDPSQPPTPLVYLPYEQSSWPTMSVIVRAPSTAASRTRDDIIARAIHAVDPSRPVYGARRLEAQLASRLALRRLQTALLSAFALAALTLALLGLHAIASYSVKQREREFSIRLALGATRSSIARGVLGASVRRVVLGLSAGIPLALFAGLLLRSAVFAISPWDPRVLVGAAGLVAAFASLASYIPALTASRVDPASSLRVDAL